uniref:RNA-dependent RNA polymerase n=1 Tax=Melanconiella theae mitovirus 1 TaxID=2897338 RepID=A0A8K1SM52_9VIRU|nr:RNA-dependent RNA polymerase [Melanconiella theae mitovirus 1]
MGRQSQPRTVRYTVPTTRPRRSVGSTVFAYYMPKNMKTNLINKQIIRLIRGLIKCLFPRHASIFFPVLEKFLRVWNNNGYAYAIKYMKALRLHVTRYVCGKPLRVSTFRVSLDKSGFPKPILFMKELLDNGNEQDKRLCLTSLLISKALIPSRAELDSVQPDYSTITDPYKGKEWTIPTPFIRDFVKFYNLKLDHPEYTDKTHILSTKGSPWGKSSMSSFHVWRLPYHLLGSIFGILRFHCEKFQNFYTHVLENGPYSSYSAIKCSSSGRLSIVEDPELKKRIIAMLDYHSQWVLRPIHDGLMNLLKHFPCDRTYTQNPFNKWKEEGNFHSLDLTAATDRFPISIQRKLMRIIYSHKLAMDWDRLLVMRNYEAPDGRTYSYSVGQPMGAYSSWAAFTLSHHLVVAYAAHRCGFKLGSFDQYILLGDDIVIKHNRVSQVYISIMGKLGVDISFQKTHVSKHTYEFAKRWIHHGKEITGLPLHGIGTNRSNYLAVYLLLSDYFEKVPMLYKGDLLDLVVKVYKNFLFKGRVLKSHSIIKSLYIFSCGLKFSKGTLTYDEFRKFICNVKNSAELHIPWEKDYLNFMKEFFSYGLVHQVQMGSKSLLSLIPQLDKLNEKFPDGGIKDNKLFKMSPIYHGMLNHLSQCSSSLEEYLEGDGKNIYDISSKISFLDPTSLFNSRDISKRVKMMKLVLKKSIDGYCGKDGMIYYGSSIANHSMDSSSFITSSQWNTDFVMDQLESYKGAVVQEFDAWGRPLS